VPPRSFSSWSHCGGWPTRSGRPNLTVSCTGQCHYSCLWSGFRRCLSVLLLACTTLETVATYCKAACKYFLVMPCHQLCRKLGRRVCLERKYESSAVSASSIAPLLLSVSYVDPFLYSASNIHQRLRSFGLWSASASENCKKISGRMRFRSI